MEQEAAGLDLSVKSKTSTASVESNHTDDSTTRKSVIHSAKPSISANVSEVQSLLLVFWQVCYRQ